MDIEIQKMVQKKKYTLMSLQFPTELQDEELWIDAISTFDKLSKEETPMEKLNVILRTYTIISEVFHMASLKEGRQMDVEIEIPMMTYVISRSISAVKLYSNFM
jgi:hypothetical protein